MDIITGIFELVLVRPIARDLIKKYNVMKKQYPKEASEAISTRVWDVWLMLNESRVINNEDYGKFMRFRVMEDKVRSCRSMLDVFVCILYIETGIQHTNEFVFEKCVKAFLKISKRYGLEFCREKDGYTPVEAYKELFALQPQ